jgi:hypothetical protein
MVDSSQELTEREQKLAQLVEMILSWKESQPDESTDEDVKDTKEDE